MEATYGQTEAAYGINEDDNLYVRFFKHSKENKAKSTEQGHPIFEELEYIEIITPGDKDNIIRRPIREHDKVTRFPRHWAAYQARVGDEEAVEGTLLEEWPGITRSAAEELKFFHIRTVEQLASMSDVNAQNVRGAATLKQKALKYLDSALSNEELSRQLAEQKQQIADLIAAAEKADKPEKATPKKRGRPKKQEPLGEYAE